MSLDKSRILSWGTDYLIDIDWEYPGGNGADYKLIPNSARVSEITTYPLLLAAVRAAIGPKSLLTIAVPGLKRDMIAYTKATVPLIAASVDYFNASLIPHGYVADVLISIRS